MADGQPGSARAVGMRRFLFFIIILYVVWRILNIVGRRVQRAAPGASRFSRFDRQGRKPSGNRRDTGEKLVPCRHCGTLLPASRALPGGDGAVYCSKGCRDSEVAEVDRGTANGSGNGA